MGKKFQPINLQQTIKSKTIQNKVDILIQSQFV